MDHRRRAGFALTARAKRPRPGAASGTPLDGVNVRLDHEGRVCVRGAAVVAPGEHTLADLGAWNEWGELLLTGRAMPLANIGGKKVSPLEIERVLRALDGGGGCVGRSAGPRQRR